MTEEAAHEEAWLLFEQGYFKLVNEGETVGDTAIREISVRKIERGASGSLHLVGAGHFRLLPQIAFLFFCVCGPAVRGTFPDEQGGRCD